MIYILLHPILWCIIITKDIINGSLIILEGKMINESGITVYELNCSSTLQPLDNDAEFIVNSYTVEHLSVDGEKCLNSKENECSVNLDNNCYCIPNQNIFIFQFKDYNNVGKTFTCQMRFTDAQNGNIIKEFVSIRFNGTKSELYEYNANIVLRPEDGNKGVSSNEHSKNLKVWLPVSFLVGLILIAIWTSWCICRRRRERKKAKKQTEQQEIKLKECKTEISNVKKNTKEIYMNKQEMFEKDESFTDTDEYFVEKHYTFEKNEPDTTSTAGIFVEKQHTFQKDEPATSTEEYFVKEHYELPYSIGIVEIMIRKFEEMEKYTMKKTKKTEEENNFIKIFRLISGVATQAVREVFDKYFPPTNLTQILEKNEHKLKLIGQRKWLNSTQMAVLFPKKGVTSSSSYDVTLMICLLRNLTTIRCPVMGFDVLPPDNETHVGADLARVKYYRNKITCSAINRLTRREFTTIWNDLEKVEDFYEMKSGNEVDGVVVKHVC